ncbi:MAG: FAD-dependent oxidoreductase [Gemmatimonadales bacterium]|nr:MAG: FAD-dependent oxidoreductase [Gemmatimonadales bacterium]
MISVQRTTSQDSAPIVIVGGGVIGVCCAYALARRGAPVLVLERDEIGRGASFGNAGTVSPGHPPINGPGRWRELVRSMVDPLSPLYIPPRLTPGLARWLWAFARHCSPGHLEHCRRVSEPFARLSLSLHDDIAAEAPDNLGYTSDGYVEIYRTRTGKAVAAHEAEYARHQGFAPKSLEAGQLRDSDPALTDSILGGYHHEEGRTMDPFRFVEHVADLARQRGAQFRTGVTVTEVITRQKRAVGVKIGSGEDIDAGVVILATGAYSPNLYRKLGRPLPVQAAKGYHLDLDDSAGRTPAISRPYLLVERAVFCTPLPGRLRLAGTLEFSGVNHDIRRPRLEQLTRSAGQYLHGVAAAPVSSEWCGLRPCMPDGLPAVGPLPGWPGVFAATGHAMLGMTFGPATGEALAELILTGRSELPLTGLDPARFC